MKTCKYCGYGVIQETYGLNTMWVHGITRLEHCHPSVRNSKKAEPV